MFLFCGGGGGSVCVFCGFILVAEVVVVCVCVCVCVWSLLLIRKEEKKGVKKEGIKKGKEEGTE